MSWLLKHGDSSREFATKSQAEEEKAKLAGLGGEFTIEEKGAPDDDVEADYVEMPYGEMDTEPETAPDATESNGGCPACGEDPECIYRCRNCGHDLAGKRVGVGRGGRR